MFVRPIYGLSGVRGTKCGKSSIFHMVLGLCREMEPVTRAGERAVTGMEYEEERKSSVTNVVDDVGRENR